MFGIKYSYPHAFFLSLAVVLFIFGIYPFYISDFNFSLISWTKIIIHSLSFLISVYFFIVGISLWNEREQEREGTIQIAKKRILQEIELKELDIQERKAQQIISELNKEITILRKSKDKTKKDIEKEVNGKLAELDQLREESLEKKREIEEKSKELSKLKKEEISKMPSNYLWANTAQLIPVSGANLAPSGISELPSAYSYSQIASSYTPAISIPRKCNKCGSSFLIGTDNLCYSCRAK